MYIGGSQNHPYPLYVRLGDSPTGGQVSKRNMKDICKAVEAVRRAAHMPQGILLTGYEIAGWCLIVCVHVVSDISE